MTSNPQMEPPVDLTLLLPAELDAGDRLVDSVMSEVRARGVVPGTRDPLVWLWQFARPLSIASAVAVVLLLLTTDGWRDRQPASVAEALGVPKEFLASTNRGAGQ